MGLDLYVGSLTRYFSGDWELIAQRVAKELGHQFQVVRKHDPDDAIRDPEQLCSIVLKWRSSISDDLGAHLTEPLEWDESPKTPYFTNKPCWDCYSALVLWAACDEQHQLTRPSHATDDWSGDPAYKSCMEDGSCRYEQIYNVSVWLPGEFSFIFEASFVGGGEVRRFGSTAELFRQLDDLNNRTWRANPQSVSQWLKDGAEFGSPLETGARFAFAVFQDLAKQANENRLPMLMDW